MDKLIENYIQKRLQIAIEAINFQEVSEIINIGYLVKQEDMLHSKKWESFRLKPKKAQKITNYLEFYFEKQQLDIILKALPKSKEKSLKV